jgi:hypothetical protein
MVAILCFVALSVGGCKSDTTSTPDRRLSRKGEACMTTNDCTTGLSCIPVPGGSAGVCVTGEFNVTQTAKECAVIQCQQPVDCCPTPPTNCPALATSCADGGGNPTACQQYNLLCKCDGTHYDCVDEQCRTRCDVDADCGGTLKCSGGKCVECVDDTVCTAGQTCLNGTCTAPCQGDGDCPAFNRCQVGKCVESGCQTDRECVAATKNVEATCGTDGKCIIPCQTDLECGNPKAYTFYSCINRQCTYVGCSSDKDCLLYVYGTADASVPNPNGKTHVVCRDKATTK